MSFIILALTLLLAVCLYLMKWHRTYRGLSIIFFALFAFIGIGVIPQYLLETLQTDYLIKPEIHWQSNNVIILLGAGTQKIPDSSVIEPTFFSFARIAEAASQYYSCEASEQNCIIIVSGGDAFHHGISEAEVYKKKLIALGINANNIINESDSMNTWQNAQFTSKIIKTEKFDNVVLVSSGLHMRRSELYFTHFGTRVTPVRADYMAAKLSLVPLWYNFAVTDLALHEFVGYIRYDVYNFMGWNTERVNPGDA